MRVFLRALFIAVFACVFAGVSHAQCDQAKTFASSTITAAGNTKLVVNNKLPNGAIHLCSYAQQIVTSTSPVTFQFVAGNGLACEVGTVAVQPAFYVSASGAGTTGSQIAPLPAFTLPSGMDLCLNLSGTVASAAVGVTYAIY